MKKYQKITPIEVVGIDEMGYVVQNVGDPSDQWVIDPDKFEKTYKEVNTSNTVTQSLIQDIIDNSIIEVQTIFDKCTVVSCQLPNGFIIVESSACVDPANYDVKLGGKICMERITNKIWELEGYKLQDEISNK